MINQKSSGVSSATQLPLRGQPGEDVDVYFARLGRDGWEEIQSTLRLLLGAPLVVEIINAMPVPVCVLNDKCQVVLTNRCWDRFVRAGAPCLLGQRHGELLECACSDVGLDGCGTAPACRTCGAAVSVQKCQQLREQVTCEFRLHRRTSSGAELSELMVTCTPIQVDGRDFILFVVHEVDARVAVKTYDV